MKRKVTFLTYENTSRDRRNMIPIAHSLICTMPWIGDGRQMLDDNNFQFLNIFHSHNDILLHAYIPLWSHINIHCLFFNYFQIPGIPANNIDSPVDLVNSTAFAK